MAAFEKVMVSCRHSIVTIALSLTIRPQFAIEYLRRSKQQEVGNFGAKYVEEGVDRCKPHFNTIWRRGGLYGLSYARKYHVVIFCRLQCKQTTEL